MVCNERKTKVGLTALLFAALTSTAMAEDAPAAAPVQNYPAIVITQAASRMLVDRVIATGTVKAVEEVYVQPQVEGLSIKTLNADVADHVEAGSALAILSDDALVLQKSQMAASRAKAEASLAQMQAQLVEAKANAAEYDRQRDRLTKLASNGTASTSQVEQAEASAAAADARTRSAEQSIAVSQADLKVVDSQMADIDLKLARTEVKTPVSGIVSVRNARMGAIAAGAGEPMFTVIRDGALELVADVAESDILKIEVGQKATVTLAGTTTKLTGAVRLISPQIDPATRLASVHIALDDSNKARAGMYGSADIIVRTTEGIALPLTAITTESSGTSARKIENDVVRLVTIVTGIQDGKYIQIVDGLKAGDDVVAKAGAYVRDGDHISPVRQPDTASN